MDLLVGLLVLFVLPLWVLSRTVVVVPAAHLGAVRRFGAWRRQVDPGLRLVIPFVERVRRVDARAQLLVLQGEPLISSDNWVVAVNAEVEFMVTDALLACSVVESYERALTDRVVAGLREAAGRIPAAELRAGLDEVAWQLNAALPSEVEPLGVRTLEVRLAETPDGQRSPGLSRTFRLAPPPG